MKLRWAILALGTIAATATPGSLALAQRREQSPAEIIRALTYQTPGANRHERDIIECGLIGRWDQIDRARANALVKLGAAALPELERAFDSILDRGQESPFAWNSAWLFYAYAGIRGREAYSRLEQLIESSPPEFSRFDLDISMAIALGLTSYVDSLRLPGIPLMCRSATPRDALDELIIAWERKDRVSLESALGPTAKAALQSMIENSSWEAVEARIWTSQTGHGSAVGYSFNVSGGWSQPWRTLGEPAVEETYDTAPNLVADFTDRTGTPCGALRVPFVPAPRKVIFTTPFLVDSPNIRELLQLISACAGQNESGTPSETSHP